VDVARRRNIQNDKDMHFDLTARFSRFAERSGATLAAIRR